MDLDELRSFVWTVRLGSITAAARRLYRTQPALSVQIQALEREAGDRLLVRGARGVRATAAGELLYRRAQLLLREADDILEELQAGGSLRRGRLRVGATDLMAIHLLPRVLERYRRRYPGVQVAVEVEGSRGLRERVLRGDLDLAFVTLPQEHADLVVRELHRDEMIWITAPDHPLAGRRRVPAERLAGEMVIQHGGDSVSRREIEGALQREGLVVGVAMEVSSPEAIRELVALGLGIAPLTRSQVQGDLRNGRLGSFRVAGLRIFRRSGLIHRRDAPDLRAAAALLALLPKGSASSPASPTSRA